jgi:hypothetical protein
MRLASKYTLLLILYAMLIVSVYFWSIVGDLYTVNDALEKVMHIRVTSSQEYTPKYLSHDWISRPLYSDLSKTIRDGIENCSAPVVYYHELYGQGMGADIHIWSQAVCNAMQNQGRLVVSNRSWIWNDKTFCNNHSSTEYYNNPLYCYFNIRNTCPPPDTSTFTFISHSNELSMCPLYINDMASRQRFRAAAMEYLFARVHPDIVNEANRAAHALFSPYIKDVTGGTSNDASEHGIINNYHNHQDADFNHRGQRYRMRKSLLTTISDRIITLHIRRGDKRVEMDLVSDSEYIDTIAQLVTNYSIQHPIIFVTTESSRTAFKFTSNVEDYHPTWKVVVYSASMSTSVFESSTMAMAQSSDGVIGRTSLVALLIAMEAKYYVLTSGSNWSRLIDELRKGVVDVDCGNCTVMIDLRRVIDIYNTCLLCLLSMRTLCEYMG